MTQVGTIVTLDPRGFGFIEADNGDRWFFNAREVRGVAFDRLTLRTRVSFTPGTRLGKLRAFSVDVRAEAPVAA